MGFAACVAVGQRRKFFITIPVVCLFAVTAAANAQSDAPEDPHPIPATETITAPVRPDAASGIDSKKLAKYDVDKIGRREVGHGFNIYSAKRERQLGQRLAASLDHNTKPITDPVINDYINQLAQRIVGNSDAEMPLTVKLIDAGDVPRAYGLPGGFLYVNTALVLSAESEAELAGVMAHEIAHVAARHATRALSRKQMFQLSGPMALLAGPASVALQDVGGLAGPLVVKKFSRDAEYEADLLGIEYAYTAGYDPQALLVALEKLHVLELKRTAALDQIPGHGVVSKVPLHNQVVRGFSDYPLTEQRIQRLQAEIAAFLPDRKDYILDTNEFQEVKTRLTGTQGPPRLRHGEQEDEKKPVLRRAPQDDTETKSGQIFTVLSNPF